jgi:hypothetical protein
MEWSFDSSSRVPSPAKKKMKTYATIKYLKRKIKGDNLNERQRTKTSTLQEKLKWPQ